MLEGADAMVDEGVATRENSKGSNEKLVAREEKFESVKKLCPKLPLLSFPFFLFAPFFGLLSYLLRLLENLTTEVIDLWPFEVVPSGCFLR